MNIARKNFRGTILKKDVSFVVTTFVGLIILFLLGVSAFAQTASVNDGNLRLKETQPNSFNPKLIDQSKAKAAAQKGEIAKRQGLLETSQAPRGLYDNQSNTGSGCQIDPTNPDVGADIPLSYFSPPASTDNPAFIGPLQLLRAGQLDRRAGTLELPLYKGRLRNGKTVWYILTDTTDQGNAQALGLNYSAKLNFAAVGRGVRTANLNRNGVLVFDQGEVNFRPERQVVPGSGENPFPPSVANPGSVGDRLYSPLVKIVNAGGHIYNAPIIAFDSSAAQIDCPEGNCNYNRVHDSVFKIDTANNTVTMRLVPGFSFARPVLYLSMDANNRTTAAIEEATFAPGLEDIPVGGDDGAFSAVERIFITINGPVGCDNPQRQGLNSALTDGRRPLNILGGIPTVSNDYSPLWDANIGEWTQKAIDSGFRSRVLEEFQILGLAERGFITGPGGTEYGSSGIIINCPIVFRFL